MAKWLTKANDSVLSFCTCEHNLAAVPGQLDCPWCGCGYLLTCSYCRKAFTFGKVTSVDQSYRELVAADATRGGYGTDPEGVAVDAQIMEEMLDEFKEGEVVVYLDGAFLAVSETDVRLKGLFAEHVLARLPHVEANGSKEALIGVLGDVDYWLERERPNRA